MRSPGYPPYVSKSIADIRKEHKKKQIEISSKLSLAVRELLQSMLRLNPLERAGVDQVLASPLFDKYKRPPFNYPLTTTEYNYMLESYVANTRGVAHLHLPRELDRLKSLHRESLASGKNVQEKTLIEEASTEYTSTFKSDTVRQTLCFDNHGSLKESLSDNLFDPGNDQCTLIDFPMLSAAKRNQSEFLAKDSMTVASELARGCDFGLGFSIYAFDWDCVVERQPAPADEFSFGVGRTETQPDKTFSELNPRVISIKRKQSNGKGSAGDSS